MSNRLCYVSAKSVVLSIRDDNVPTQVKSNMAHVMLETEPKRFFILFKYYVFVFCKLRCKKRLHEISISIDIFNKK